jgi:hypothetical protein
LSLDRLVGALFAAVAAYIATGIAARLWRKSGRKFLLRVGRDQSWVFDETGREVFTIRNVLSYSGGGNSLNLTGIGDADPGAHGSSSVMELGALPPEDAVQIFAAFVLFCRARARSREAVPVWRYATIDLEMSEDYESIMHIVRAAGDVKFLRYAVGKISIND